MTLSQLRRKINDSYIGQKINHTIPGILVEGTSRFVRDAFADAACHMPDDFDRQDKVIHNYYAWDATPRSHYSHKSPIYRQVIVDGKLSAMERIPTLSALFPNTFPKPEPSEYHWVLK